MEGRTNTKACPWDRLPVKNTETSGGGRGWGVGVGEGGIGTRLTCTNLTVVIPGERIKFGALEQGFLTAYSFQKYFGFDHVVTFYMCHFKNK